MLIGDNTTNEVDRVCGSVDHSGRSSMELEIVHPTGLRIKMRGVIDMDVFKTLLNLTNRNYKKILSPDEIELFKKLKAKNPLVHELWDLSEEFRNIFENKSIPEFQKWIEKIGNSSFQGLKSFVKGLIKDFEAIKAAIIYDDNNGLTEGNVNRLKNIKRQMYGRASFELLRKKVVLSCTG